jgi:hypothetical protein
LESGKSFAGKTHLNFDIEINVFPSFFSKTFPQKSGNSAPKISLLGGHYLLIYGKPYKMVIWAC